MIEAGGVSRHAHRAASKRKYPGKPNPQFAGGVPEIFPWRMAGNKGRSRFGTEETELQQGPSQEATARERIRTHLPKGPKEGETLRGRVGGVQKWALQDTRGLQRRGRRGKEAPKDKLR